MKRRPRQSRENISVQIDNLASAMSKAFEGIEVRMNKIEDEQIIFTNQLLNLSNRLNYIEKKVLK